MIGIGVIGCDYWGPNLVRNFADTPGARVVAVCDRHAVRLAPVASRYPSVRVATEARDLIDDPAVDAVVVATPVASHCELAMAALRAGKHVLVEKPLSDSAETALQLIAEADRRGLVLMVDHTFVYTSAVAKMRELVRAGELGDIQYYDSVGINLGLFQHDVGVLWDLAVHDLSIMDHVLGRQPEAVSATGLAHIPGQPVSIAYVTLFFDGRLLGHVHVNWLAPVKVRRTLLGGSRRMIVFDDLEASEKLKVYDRGVSVNSSPENDGQLRVGYRMGDMWVPQLELREALSVVAAHFVACVSQGRTPITDGHAGLRVVRLLEAATASLSQQGRPVPCGGADSRLRRLDVVPHHPTRSLRARGASRVPRCVPRSHLAQGAGRGEGTRPGGGAPRRRVSRVRRRRRSGRRSGVPRASAAPPPRTARHRRR